MKPIIAAILLFPFALFSVWVSLTFGYTTIFTYQAASPVGMQVFTDLALALTMVLVFMRQHAQSRGLLWWPWVLATPALGSLAPLAYFVYAGIVSKASPQE